jgi:hypothetical protein
MNGAILWNIRKNHDTLRKAEAARRNTPFLEIDREEASE